MIQVRIEKDSYLKCCIHNIIKSRELLFMTLPMVLFIFVFNYIPMMGIVIAFQDFRYDKGIFESSFNGIKNFELFFSSPDMWQITRNTIGYNASFIVLELVIGVTTAFLLFGIVNKKALRLYQTVLFIPHFISWVVVAYMVYAFLSPGSGLISKLISYLGGGATINFYLEPIYWIFIFPIAQVWKVVGFSSLIYYAGLLGIDTEYIEAASIEGASKWQVITKIQLPFLYPLISILTILAIGRIFNADFGLFYQLPMDSKLLYPTTDVIETYVFRALTFDGNIALSSASGVYKSIVGFVLVIVTNAVVKKINPENSLY